MYFSKLFRMEAVKINCNRMRKASNTIGASALRVLAVCVSNLTNWIIMNDNFIITYTSFNNQYTCWLLTADCSQLITENTFYFHNFITPSRLLDTSTGYFCVLHMSKSVTTSLWPGDGISGPERGECSSDVPFAVFDIPLDADALDFVLVCTS